MLSISPITAYVKLMARTLNVIAVEYSMALVINPK